MKKKETAEEYLMRSSLGEKFEYEELDFMDDGLFGGEMYEGMGRFGEYGERSYKESAEEVSLDLYFEEKEENLHHSQSYHFRNMMLVVTPRDPRGPYTIGVYQDFTLVGWISGSGTQKLALHLVNNYKNCAAVFPLEGIDFTNIERKINLFIPDVEAQGVTRLDWDEIANS